LSTGGADDYGLPGPPHARRRAALAQYAWDVAQLAVAEALPPRKRAAFAARAGWVQGLAQARGRVERADARMGGPCRRVARRVACLGESLARCAAELGHDGPDAVRALLVAAADECAAVYEV
jgi:hypothetical protein